MELSDIQKKQENKDIILTVRTTKEDKEWMDKNNISPSLLFDKAIKDIKNKLKKNVKRTICVVCGKPSKDLDLGLGMSSTSFCSKKCMNIYTSKVDPHGRNLEVSGMKIYVK